MCSNWSRILWRVKNRLNTRRWGKNGGLTWGSMTQLAVHESIVSLWSDNLRPPDPKRTILLSSAAKMLCHFSLGQSICFLSSKSIFPTLEISLSLVVLPIRATKSTRSPTHIVLQRFLTQPQPQLAPNKRKWVYTGVQFSVWHQHSAWERLKADWNND